MNLGIIMTLIIVAIFIALSLKSRNAEISGLISLAVCICIIFLSLDKLKVIIKTLDKIKNEYNLKDSFSDEIISCHTHSLFYLLMRNTESCIDIDNGNRVIEQAVAYIKENFASDITLSSLAKMFSVSPEHFSRLFKKETGLGFSKYLNSLRLQYAEQLLRSAEGQNITQVAEICGFEDSNYFSKKFKEVYGISPKKVQKKD